MTLLECKICVMDTQSTDLLLDDSGVCQFCRDAEQTLQRYSFSKDVAQQNLDALAERVKKGARGKYDCVVGLSGGVDSSYVALLAMRLGLNPLCVHFDNGWNSDIAVKNIRKIIDVANFDLQTYVINWPEFRDLQRSFLKAGVVDIELLTDQAIFAALFGIRKQYKITTVLSGTNYVTEHGMPSNWIWNKMDLRNLKAIHKRFGEVPLDTYPSMNTFTWQLMRQFGIGGVFEEPLNLIEYNKPAAMKELKEAFGWQYYGGKHYESIFTKFYQAHILPMKFGIDKRKVHLSALVRAGQITRAKAKAELKEPLYEDLQLINDKRFVMKKLGFSEEEFDRILATSPVRHNAYPTDTSYMRPLVKVAKFFLRKTA